jgi:hypothetical protein
MADMDEVSQLLSIVNQASDHSGKLNGIVGYAMDRLLEINAELRDEQMKKAAARAQGEAEAQAKRDAEAAKANDYEGDANPSNAGGRFAAVSRKV